MQDAVWWIELIKVSPSLLAALLATGVILYWRRDIGERMRSMTQFKVLGMEAVFDAKALDKAIESQGVAVSLGDRRGALKRMHFIAPILRDMRLLWVDDNPTGTRSERALLEDVGIRITVVVSSADAEKELRNHLFTLMITDLRREGRDDEGLRFVSRARSERFNRWTIAYVSTDQFGLGVPPGLFGITHRPDHLLHLVCDVAERERL